MNEWIFISLILLGFIFGVGVFSWILGTIVQDVFEAKWTKEFTRDLKDAVKHSQPNWDEVKEIASTRGLTQSKIQLTLKRFYREILTGRDQELLSHKELIKSYIDKYSKDEPFEGLPNEVRIHLERLREQLNGNEHHLEPLTSQIKDLLTVNEKDRRYQRFYTAGGFFVGIIGLGLAAYTLLAQPEADTLELEKLHNIEVKSGANKTTPPDS